MISKIIKVNGFDIEFNNPLIKAVNENQEIIVELLLSAGADVNGTKDIGYESPLWIAAKFGYATIACMLINRPETNLDYQCANLNEAEKSSYANLGRRKISVIEIATLYGHDNIVSLIQDKKELRKLHTSSNARLNFTGNVESKLSLEGCQTEKQSKPTEQISSHKPISIQSNALQEQMQKLQQEYQDKSRIWQQKSELQQRQINELTSLVQTLTLSNSQRSSGSQIEPNAQKTGLNVTRNAV